MRVINVYNPRKIIFGEDALSQFTQDMIQANYKRLFILTSPSVSKLITDVITNLESNNISLLINSSLSFEPTFDDFEKILLKVRDFKPDCVVGIGGGSVLDLSKILAVFNTFKKPVRDYVGINNIPERETPVVCVPTTSGTGSEVSPNSILLDEENNAKVGIISPFLVADAAYVDPSLTKSLPPDITAYTSIDALTHCIEAYVNKFAHPLVDPIALEGISLIANNLKIAFDNGENVEARSNLALGSMYGGMCIGPVNTGAVHALAYPLGSFYKIAHGLSNAVLLPYVLRFNLPNAVAKYAAAARAMGIESKKPDPQVAEEGIELLVSLMKSCNIPERLRDLNIEEKNLPEMAESALQVQRLLKNNVREVTYEDAMNIYKEAF